MPELKPECAKNINTSEESEICATFRQYAAELDARHDRRERLIKISRDVTIESKRIIFFLHSLIKSKDRNSGLETAEKRIHSLVSGPLCRAVNESAMGGFHPLTPGLQELAEAYCLLHHMREPSTMTLPAWEHLSNYVAQPDIKTKFPSILSPMDFMLGVADFTGELMRLCINSVATGDVDVCFNIRDIMQHLYTQFLRINVFCHRDMLHKLHVLRQSLLKVETACCDIKLRGCHSLLLTEN